MVGREGFCFSPQGWDGGASFLLCFDDLLGSVRACGFISLLGGYIEISVVQDVQAGDCERGVRILLSVRIGKIGCGVGEIGTESPNSISSHLLCLHSLDKDGDGRSSRGPIKTWVRRRL